MRCGAQTQRKGRPTRLCKGGRSRHRTVRPAMKPLAQRNRAAIGVVGVVVTGGITWGDLHSDKLPSLPSGAQYSAPFTKAGGLRSGAVVQVSGYRAGKVSS